MQQSFSPRYLSTSQPSRLLHRGCPRHLGDLTKASWVEKKLAMKLLKSPWNWLCCLSTMSLMTNSHLTSLRETNRLPAMYYTLSQFNTNDRLPPEANSAVKITHATRITLWYTS